jgi:alpha-tubulin suppressor-like RCC1 family protein
MDRASAAAVQGGHTFTQLAAGYQHTCGLTTAGAIYCWGYGSSGSIGDDHRDESAAPVTVDGVPGLTRLGEALYPTCALDGAGSAWCWPTSFGVSVAHQIGGATGLVSATGPCGLRVTGEMLCWGRNSGWFGDGTYEVQTENAVPGGNGIRFAEVSFGLSGTACGIALDGTTYCWGNSFDTSLGSPDSRGDLATLPLKLYGSP